MLVAFDTTFLVPLLDPQVKGTGEVDARISHLIATLDRQRAKIVIPTPALSEVLIGAADAAPAYLEILSKNSRFRIAPFGERRRSKPPHVIARPYGLVIKRKVR
jgi:hypothetical protein